MESIVIKAFFNKKFYLLLFLFLTGIYPVLCAENNRNIYLDSPYYSYLDYLINSGQYIPEFVLQQPLHLENLDSLNLAGAGNYYTTYWETFYTTKLLSGQLNLQDQLRWANTAVNRFRASGSIHMITPHAVFANRTTFDQDYKYDPNYAGDLSESKNWLYGRVNDAYMQISYHGLGLFIGRMQRNWGPVNEMSLILSAYPYSYDHFLLYYQYKKIRFSLIFARLEDLEAEYLASKKDTLVSHIESARKFLIGHRFDIMFSRKLQIALTEMATYGGEDRSLEFEFLNPMNFYYGIQRNDGKQMNGLWALDLFFKPFNRISMYGQILIDDYIVNNEPGTDDRAQYPDRLALLFSVRSGDLGLQGLNTSLGYVRVWNRTYQSIRTYENYHYRGLGLGYACAGCEEIKINLSYWNLFPWVIENEFIYGRYGNVRLTDLFMLNKENFPIAPVTHNIYNQVTFHFYPSRRTSVWLQGLYIKEKNYYLNRIDPFTGLAIRFGVQAMLSGGFAL